MWSTKSIENKRTKAGAENQCIHRDNDTVHFKRVCTRIQLSENFMQCCVEFLSLFPQMFYSVGHIKEPFSLGLCDRASLM